MLNDLEYWKNEIESNFPDRDKLGNGNIFVITYMQSPPPCNICVHEIMNFGSLSKAVSFIKNIIVRRAVGDTLGIEYSEAMEGSFEMMLGRFCESNTLTFEQSEAVSMYRELEGFKCEPEAEAIAKLKDFRERFEKLFHYCAECIHGMEIVFSDESLVDFWENFFELDREDEYHAEELKLLKQSLDDGDADTLDALMAEHCG